MTNLYKAISISYQGLSRIFVRSNLRVKVTLLRRTSLGPIEIRTEDLSNLSEDVRLGPCQGQVKCPFDGSPLRVKKPTFINKYTWVSFSIVSLMKKVYLQLSCSEIVSNSSAFPIFPNNAPGLHHRFLSCLVNSYFLLANKNIQFFCSHLNFKVFFEE